MSSPLSHHHQSAPANRHRQASVMTRLSREIDGLATASRNPADKPPISSGCEAMDRLLPVGGYLPGSVVEYLRHTPASGASHLAFLAARQAMKATGGFLIVVDHLEQIYPPKLHALGIDLKKVIFVRPASDTDAVWAVDQALRTPAVAAVFAEIPRLDDQAARRMQLAAERGDGLGLLVRSASARKGPSWAEVQWLVRSMGRPRLSALKDATGSPVAQAAQQQVGDSASRQAAGASSDDRYLHLRLARAKGSHAGRSLSLRISGCTGAVVEYQPPIRTNQPVRSSVAHRTGVA